MDGLEDAGLLHHHARDGAQQDGHVCERDLCYDLCACFAKSDTTVAEAAPAHVASSGFPSRL
jgi:hypothetical protein